jgi:arylsulfatase A-like enzyme
MDLGATVLELAGISVPSWMDAQSLVPALRGKEWAGRDHVFSEHARDAILSATELMTMVRNDAYKLVEFVDHDDGQLFDLVHDPWEETNLWESVRYREARADLQQAIRRWRATSELHAAGWMATYR